MSSPSPEQAEKSKLYDRQLRLWGDHGQYALEHSKVCLINATGLGTEILKSLVLAGIGGFTIVDNGTVTEEDLGNNFFFDVDSINLPRASSALHILSKLNPEVFGDFMSEPVEQLIGTTNKFFKRYSVVIATSLPERILIPLSELLWSYDIPLIVAKSIGFIGYMRIQMNEHTVIESHPDSQNPDLRLDKPFPSLVQYVNSLDLDKMDLKDHAHIPYVVPLLNSINVWRKTHDFSLPSNSKEKEELRQIIRNGIKVNDDGVPEAEENFEEAIRAVNFAVTPTKVPNEIKKILEDNNCINITSKSKPFWILARALKEFVENEGENCLPVRGTLPDMTAETTRYIDLQQIYLQENLRCSEIVYNKARQILQKVGLNVDMLSEGDIKHFCKYASSLAVIRGTKIADEYTLKPVNASLIFQSLEEPDNLMVYYVMLRGVDRFYSDYNCHPGEFGDEHDIVKLKACVQKLLSDWGCGSLCKDDYIHEMFRCGGAELHSISAFLGGCAAQEVIKLVTKQYKPLHNTFIFDAITSSTQTFVF